ncbi:SDR family oxidoreductase [Furfurilactobacillus siliginis]|uniref:Putative NAD-dependent epimerase/dehydratase n=1 Tax=Furfurilactobacillus siliginis TaxID=348151 RepID=A0A0R2LBH0_9LACO|nr:SDR family oxidoreductase [Furfurilactobacillus siliginis]KRN96620.1 hypothetical protein IV55_GL001143 [Furfurilactobacillus siliginis]GEK29381.1 putative NAD-dependent epimerase/dehydratase [Furfurilactobacillus siliginis]
MKVFVTGATGFIGAKVVQILLAHGHSVVGLARSDRSAQQLADWGATAVHGTLDDTKVIAQTAEQSDGVIHLAFTNDFSDYKGALSKDQAAISAIGDALAGSNKPFVNTSGTLMVTGLGRDATEADVTSDAAGRGASELLSLSYADKNVRTSVVRLAPTVHSEARQGFGTLLAQLAAKQGKIGYVGDGANVWPSVHRDDAAELFVAALEHGQAGHVYNAVAESGIAVKDILTTIGTTMKLPIEHFTEQEAAAFFGWFAQSITVSNPTSSAQTQAELDWHPTHTGLLADLTTFLSNPANVDRLKQQ